MAKQGSGCLNTLSASNASILSSGPSCPGFDSGHSRDFFRGKIVKVAEVNQRRCQEESGRLIENVDQTHLVLAGGELVLLKTCSASCE